MKPETLLRLYPAEWRARYGEEFLAILGSGTLSVQQMVDVFSGAIDAWLSPDVHEATRIDSLEPNAGGSKMLKAMLACEGKRTRYTKRDSLVGSGVMLGVTILLCWLGVVAKHSGWTAAGEMMVSMAFPVSLTLSMPFWVMKGQPWKAQVVIVGGTLVLLVVIGWLSYAFS